MRIGSRLSCCVCVNMETVDAHAINPLRIYSPNLPAVVTARVHVRSCSNNFDNNSAASARMAYRVVWTVGPSRSRNVTAVLPDQQSSKTTACDA